ncbi:MAG TPA: tetratricopeptide repeat protein [Clostridiales bacterium]|nr:tetratricopeptide repeat protein [Clostridiales bacterium]
MFCSKHGAGIEGANNFCIECGGFAWLVLAIFILQGSFLIKSILLVINQKTISFIWTPVSSIITYLLFIFVFIIYIKSINRELLSTNISTTSSHIDFMYRCASLARDFITLLTSSFSTLLFLWGVFSGSGLIISRLYSLVVKAGMDNPGQGMLILAGYAMLVLLMQFLLIEGLFLLYISARYRLTFFKTGKALDRINIWMLKHLPRMVILDLALSAMIVLLYFFQNFGGNIIQNIQPYGFLQTFLKYLLSSVLAAAILAVIFSQASKMAGDNRESFEAIANSNFRSIPVIPVIFALIAAASVFILPIQPQDGYASIIADIRGHSSKGDILRDAGYMTGAIKEYDDALSKLYSLQAYLLTRKSIISGNASLRNESSKLMASAKALDLLNGYAALFEGRISLEENQPSIAVNTFRKGIKNPLAIPETFAGLLEASIPAQNKEVKEMSIDWLLGNEIYHDKFAALGKASLKKLDKWIEQLNEMQKDLEPNLVYKYYEKTMYYEHQEALNGLLSLKEKYPDNGEVNYLLTRTLAEFRNEQNNYSMLIDSAKAFSNSIENYEDRDVLLAKDSYSAKIHMLANDYVTSEKIFDDLYRKYPDSRETAETYLYLLIKNQKFNDALKLAKELEKGEKNPTLVYNHSICLLNMNNYAESLSKIKEIEKYSEPYSEEYDRYLYAYSLAYVNAIKFQEHVDLLENQLGDALIKYYILAMKGWKERNSEESNLQLNKIIAKDKRLGYVWYCKGVNAYENAVRTNSGNFEDSIKYYLKSLQILPEHVEGYFALGHCYNKAGMKEEALRAFRKVVRLVPYEDHRVDPYGMVVHAWGEIDRLSNELERGNR